MSQISILIGADIVPTKSNVRFFEIADVNQLFSDNLLGLLSLADFRVFNLETPLSDVESPIEKCGPNLIAPTNSVNGIKAINPSLLTLANNHIMDQGVVGLNSTMDTLKNATIPYIGVGHNLNSICKSHIFEKNGIKVAIYACAEHEFSIAEENVPGANPFDPLESFDEIKQLKLQNDYVVVLYHGAKEEYQYPSPRIRKCFKKFSEYGADIVIAQHTHCVGCYEQYNESTLVYGQGNFLFDDSTSELWKTSLLIQVMFNKDSYQVDFLPLKKKGCSVQLAENIIAKKILSDFESRSKNIKKKGFVEERYRLFSLEMLGMYLRQLRGNPFYLKVFAKLFGNGVVTKFYSKKKLLTIQNFIECEAHREVIIKGLQEYRLWK